MFFKNLFNTKQINIVIKILTLSDITILGGFGLITPIFAIFIVDTIQNADIETAGIASGIYLVSKSIFQIPFGYLIDKTKGEKDDFRSLFIGSFLYSFVPLLYIFIKEPYQLFILQFIYGIFAAAAYPAWMAIFTRHIDKNYEGFEWSLYTSLVNLGMAGAALLSGFIAKKFGFNNLFILVSLCSFLGTGFLLLIYKKMKPGRIIIPKGKK